MLLSDPLLNVFAKDGDAVVPRIQLMFIRVVRSKSGCHYLVTAVSHTVNVLLYRHRFVLRYSNYIAHEWNPGYREGDSALSGFRLVAGHRPRS